MDPGLKQMVQGANSEIIMNSGTQKTPISPISSEVVRAECVVNHWIDINDKQDGNMGHAVHFPDEASGVPVAEDTEQSVEKDFKSLRQSKRLSNYPSPPPSSHTSSAQVTKTKEGTQTTAKAEQLSRLEFLKELYDQGFITQVEFKERKSQMIDEFTGTRTRTTTSNSVRGSARIERPREFPTIVPSPPPSDWSHIREETALKHCFEPATKQWTSSVCKVKIDTTPFAAGGLRKCFHMHMPSDPTTTYVTKLSIDPFEDREIYFVDVEMQMVSKEFAKKFNDYNPPKRVDFVKAWLLELIEREDRPLCGVEKFIDGPYRKHNNNFGFVSEDERNTPQAFSHFTYEASMHMILICDIQGVGDQYTDPQIHTLSRETGPHTVLSGKGDMGAKGISRFLATHQCNAICRYLRLPLINAKLIDGGTVPATTYMSFQKVDVVNVEFHHAIPPHLQFSDPKRLSTRSPLIPKAEEAQPEPKRSCCTIL